MFTELNQPTGATLTLMADDTIPGPANDETDVVPSDIRDVPNLLAWSQDDDDLDEPRPSWRRACGLAGLIALSSLVIAVAVAAFGSNQGHQTASAPSPTPSSRTAPARPQVTLPPIIPSAAPSTVTLPPAPPPVADSATTPEDRQFLAMLRRDGVPVGSPPDLVAAAADVCLMIKRGNDFGYIESFMTAPRGTLTQDQAEAFLADARTAYCPHAALG